MKRGLLFVFVVALLAAAAVLGLVAAAVSAGSATVARFKVDGYAFAAFGTCPDTPDLPPAGTVCRDAFVLMAREGVAVGGGPVAPPKTQWYAILREATLTFDGTDEPTETDVRFGVLPVVDAAAVSYDREHLGFASLRATIPMDDGTDAAVDLEWSAISERFVYGNDGPALADFGLDRHHVDRCSTQVNQGHQKFRLAAMTGRIDGHPVQSYVSFPSAYISFNLFVSVDVAHGKLCS